VWDLFDGFGSGKQLGIQAHNGPVASVQADGVKIVSGGLDGAVRVWKKDSGAGILEISGHTAYLGSVQFQGHKLVADGTNNVCVLHDFRDSEYVEGDIFWMEDE
jgi:WD40 repeat protein